MEETQRFLRYVMPGALFLIEAIFLLMLLWPDWTAGRLKELALILAPMKSEGAIIGAIAIILGLSALGYLFSIIHHLTQDILGGFDHRLVIERLIRRNTLQIFDADNGELLPVEERPSRRQQAWVIVNALWHERVESDPMIKGANPRANKLADIVHSIGAVRVGAAFAILVVPLMVCYVANPSPEKSILFFAIAAMLIISLHFFAYRRISRNAENLISEILEDALTESFWNSERPVRTFIALR